MENLTIAKKWMGAKEAHQSIETGKGFVCHDGKTLYVLAEVEASASGKQKFSARVDNGTPFEAYLEKLTRIVKGSAALTDEVKKVEGKDSKGRQTANEFDAHKIESVESIPTPEQREERILTQFAAIYDKIDKLQAQLEAMFEKCGTTVTELEHFCRYTYNKDVERFKAAMAAKTQQAINNSAEAYVRALREYIAQYDGKIVAMLTTDQQKAMLMALNKGEKIEKAQRLISYFEGKIR